MKYTTATAVRAASDLSKRACLKAAPGLASIGIYERRARHGCVRAITRGRVARRGVRVDRDELAELGAQH